ncbi:calcium-dependent phosphotriesterase [Panus rudis PR-1116 ss-1]|nr:calcium-dependent phosphotriesterase [Panus rudis PR-1116 ss-1]
MVSVRALHPSLTTSPVLVHRARSRWSLWLLPLPSFSSVIIDPLSFNVLGQNATFRQSANQFFNPTNTTPPFFQIFHPDFLIVLGERPSIRSIASNPNFAFAHEGPVWFPDTDEVTFASDTGGLGPIAMADINHNNQVGKISMKEVADAIKKAGPGVAPVNVSVTKLDLPDTIQMANGGTGPFHGNLLLVGFGRGTRPSSVTLSNPNPPFNTTVLLDNFFGRQFNSLNDIKIHPTSKKLFFTDVDYGFLLRLRSAPLLPFQVYSFDPDTGIVRVVADGLDKPNGLAFSQDGKTAFVVDSGVLGATFDQTRPSTIYAFDVDPRTQAFSNKRVFAFVDTGFPDGIQLDTKGNVYAGTGEGVQVRLAVDIGSLHQVWNSEGTLIGKFFLGTVTANMVFAGKGKLVILAGSAIYLAEIAAEAPDLSVP